MPTEFTPLSAFAGGLLIGLAAVLWLALHGRILGATGVLAGLLRRGDPADWRLRAALVLGMAAGPPVLAAATGAWPSVTGPVPPPALVLGGLIVGFGASLGGGCTSGHGVCGIARFSPRSVAATATFLASAIATVFVIRHVIGGL
jgi:hypothetical protein